MNLGGNDLTSVPQRALSIFDNLKKLEIQENKIRVITEGDFEGKLFFIQRTIINRTYKFGKTKTLMASLVCDIRFEKSRFTDFST